MKRALQQARHETVEPGEDARHRLCAVTRERLPIEALIRFVEGPEGQVVPDLRHKLPGRGIWVTLGQSRVGQALAHKVFQRGLKKPVTVDVELPVLVDRLLLKYALDSLSMANKAGCLVLGFERVLQAISERKSSRLIHASDAGDDGTAKLDAKLKAIWIGAGDIGPQPLSITCFGNGQLSLALGKPNVIHGALIDAPAARNFVEQTERLLRYRSQ